MSLFESGRDHYSDYNNGRYLSEFFLRELSRFGAKDYSMSMISQLSKFGWGKIIPTIHFLTELLSINLELVML